MMIRAKLLVCDDGLYSSYVFEDLNLESNDENKYVYCVKPPNWRVNPSLSINDIGYLEVKYVRAGETEWYSADKKDFTKYKYNTCYFINFIKEIEKDGNTKEFNF